MAGSSVAVRADRRRSLGAVAGLALAIGACLCASAAVAAPGAWVPTGALAAVPVIKECDATGGDVAVTRLDPPTIYVCPRVVALIRRKNPGAETFYLVHEYGHIALNTADEAAVDCWAAHALAPTAGGRRAVAAVVALLRQRPADDSPRYGTPAARAARIERCADEAQRSPES